MRLKERTYQKPDDPKNKVIWVINNATIEEIQLMDALQLTEYGRYPVED